MDRLTKPAKRILYVMYRSMGSTHLSRLSFGEGSKGKRKSLEILRRLTEKGLVDYNTNKLYENENSLTRAYYWLTEEGKKVAEKIAEDVENECQYYRCVGSWWPIKNNIGIDNGDYGNIKRLSRPVKRILYMLLYSDTKIMLYLLSFNEGERGRRNSLEILRRLAERGLVDSEKHHIHGDKNPYTRSTYRLTDEGKLVAEKVAKEINDTCDYYVDYVQNSRRWKPTWMKERY